MKKIIPLLFLLLLIAILQLIALWPSFHLALFGDDWLAFWRVWTNLDTSIPGGQHTPMWRYFLTPYGPQDMNMGLLRHFFGFSALPYYVISFLWRLAASFALFFVVLKMIRSKLAAFFSGAFFAVSSIGLDTTNWVFNMTSYTGLLFLTCFTFFYFYSRQKKSFKLVWPAFIFLFLAIVTVPIRMHGALILIMFSEGLWLVSDRSKQNLKYTFFRIALFVLTLLVIKTVGTSFADPNETVTRASKGLALIVTYLQKGYYEVLLYPVMAFGNMVFPEELWVKLPTATNPFLQLSALVFITYFLLLYLLTPKEKRTKTYIYKHAAAVLSYNFLVWLLHKNDIQNFSATHLIGSALVGGYATILLVSLIINRFFGKTNLVFPAAAVIWPYAFFMMPWIFDPYIVYPQNHRYMIISAAGVALIWAILTLLKISRKVLIYLFVLTLFMQIYTTHNYLDNLAHRRGREISEKIWTVLEKELPRFDINKIYVVLFASEITNGDIVYNTAFFGFPPRIAVRDGIYVYRAPIAVTDYIGVVSAVTDGKTMKSSGYAEKPVPPDQILAFLITGQTLDQINVQNITPEVQKDLAKRSAEYLKAHPGVTFQN